MIDGENVVGEGGDLGVGEIEFWHAAYERGAKRVGIAEELEQPVALNGAAFPSEVGGHVAAAAVDGVTRKTIEVGDELARFAGGLVVRRRQRGNGFGGGDGERALVVREQSAGERVDLGWSECVLRHLQRSAKGAGLFDLGSDVGVKIVIDARGEGELVDRLGADFCEFGGKVFGALDAIDFVTRGATIVVDEALAVGDLLGRGRVEVKVGEEIGVGFGEEESSEFADLLVVEAVVRHAGGGVVVMGIANPRLEPLGANLGTDFGEFGADVAADEISGGVLNGVAGGTEGLAVEAAGLGLESGVVLNFFRGVERGLD